MRITKPLLLVAFLLTVMTAAYAANPITLYQVRKTGMYYMTSPIAPYPYDLVTYQQNGYKIYDSAHRIDGKRSGSLVRLFELINQDTGDTFFTTNRDLANTYQVNGYVLETFTAGYVSARPLAGYVPFYGAFNPSISQHCFGDSGQISKLGSAWSFDLKTPVFYIYK